jgi:hypothetical protein
MLTTAFSRCQLISSFLPASTSKEYIKMKDILFLPPRLAAAIGVVYVLMTNNLFVREREREKGSERVRERERERERER